MKLMCVIVVAVVAGATAWSWGAEPETTAATPGQERFTRLFAWGSLRDEEYARKAKEIGVTDITARNARQVELAKKYGMRAYVGFTPVGVHKQVIRPQERALQQRLKGAELPPLPAQATDQEKAQRRAMVDAIRWKLQTQWGGEPAADAPEEDVLMSDIACFAGPEAAEKTRATLRQLCEIPGIDGVSFDYIGYVNFRGCYCDTCQALYQRHLAEHQLADTPANRDAFHLQQLVEYNNLAVDTVRSVRPDLKIMAHIYPVFLPEPLYGNRLKVDYCGQTAAWYFLWPGEKITSYTRRIVDEQERYFAGVKGVPFIGYYHKPESFPIKTAQRVEMELQAMLAGGADSVMVCSLTDVIDQPEIAEVFRKYCGDGRR